MFKIMKSPFNLFCLFFLCVNALFAVPPTVTSISPFFGPKIGGTTVTVKGTDFNGVTSVQFGSTPGINQQFPLKISLTY